MFCSRKCNSKINRIHERALRIAYDDYNSDFIELLSVCGTETKHISNIKRVAIEMFKVKNAMSPKIINELFTIRNFDGTRASSCFTVNSRNTVSNGDMSLRTFGPIIWNDMLPSSLKSIKIISKFKKEIKLWTPDCKCRLCKNYVQGVGFVS